MVDLRQFRQFVAVAEEMSFRRAAQRLNMAQPPLSAAVRRIENELGVVLLERSRRVVRLTEPGRVFLDEAKRTIAQADRAITTAQRAGHGTVGYLRVTFVPVMAHDLLPSVLRTFRERHPGIELELVEAPTGQQVPLLKSEQCDIGLVVLPLMEGTGLMLETVYRDRLVAAVPRTHRLAARRKIALADLRNEPWILCPPQQAPGFCTRVATACATAGFVPQVAQHAVQMSTILGLVAGHLGVCVVPASLVKRRADLAFRPLTGPGTPISYDLGAVWRGDGIQPALMAFLETIRTVMRHRPVRTN